MTNLEELVSYFHRKCPIMFEMAHHIIFIRENFRILQSMKNINGYLMICGLDTICAHIFYLRNNDESVI